MMADSRATEEFDIIDSSTRKMNENGTIFRLERLLPKTKEEITGTDDERFAKIVYREKVLGIFPNWWPRRIQFMVVGILLAVPKAFVPFVDIFSDITLMVKLLTYSEKFTISSGQASVIALTMLTNILIGSYISACLNPSPFLMKLFPKCSWLKIIHRAFAPISLIFEEFLFSIEKMLFNKKYLKKFSGNRANIPIADLTEGDISDLKILSSSYRDHVNNSNYLSARETQFQCILQTYLLFHASLSATLKKANTTVDIVDYFLPSISLISSIWNLFHTAISTRKLEELESNERKPVYIAYVLDISKFWIHLSVGSLMVSFICNFISNDMYRTFTLIFAVQIFPFIQNFLIALMVNLPRRFLCFFDFISKFLETCKHQTLVIRSLGFYKIDESCSNVRKFLDAIGYCIILFSPLLTIVSIFSPSVKIITSSVYVAIAAIVIEVSRSSIKERFLDEKSFSYVFAFSGFLLLVCLPIMIVPPVYLITCSYGHC